ncbi:MAG: hypothetical protein AAGF20_01630 [Pseudomonadota bacterium]
MPVIGAILAILGFIVVWYWRLKMLRDAANDAGKVIETARNLPRKMRFRHRSGKGGLDVVEDPREAAAILMLEVAQARGTLTERQEATIRGEIMHHFDFSEEDANALMLQAGWLSRNAGAAHTVVGRMTDYVQKTAGMGRKELVDLDGMLVAVSEAEGSPVEPQLDLIAIYRKKTDLRI